MHHQQDADGRAVGGSFFGCGGDGWTQAHSYIITGLNERLLQDYFGGRVGRGLVFGVEGEDGIGLEEVGLFGFLGGREALGLDGGMLLRGIYA